MEFRSSTHSCGQAAKNSMVLITVANNFLGLSIRFTSRFLLLHWFLSVSIANVTWTFLLSILAPALPQLNTAVDDDDDEDNDADFMDLTADIVTKDDEMENAYDAKSAVEVE